MARDGKGPANTVDGAIRQALDELDTRLRILERNAILTSPVVDPEKITDPMEGEHVIDFNDDKHAWYVNEAWHKADAALPLSYCAISLGNIEIGSTAPDGEQELFPFSPGGSGILTNDADCFVYDSASDELRCHKEGIYMAMATISSLAMDTYTFPGGRDINGEFIFAVVDPESWDLGPLLGEEGGVTYRMFADSGRPIRIAHANPFWSQGTGALNLFNYFNASASNARLLGAAALCQADEQINCFGGVLWAVRLIDLTMTIPQVGD